MNRYIIPANSKKSQLILGYFTMTDLILFGAGVTTTMIMLMAVPNPGMSEIIIMLLPVLITSFLVMPVMHYHNVLQFITNVVSFYSNKRSYHWKGWCIRHESEIE
ncbi:MAG: hypothetical protein R3Y13_04875 [bacterium]